MDCNLQNGVCKEENIVFGANTPLLSTLIMDLTRAPADADEAEVPAPTIWLDYAGRVYGIMAFCPTIWHIDQHGTDKHVYDVYPRSSPIYTVFKVDQSQTHELRGQSMSCC